MKLSNQFRQEKILHGEETFLSFYYRNRLLLFANLKDKTFTKTVKLGHTNFNMEIKFTKDIFGITAAVDFYALVLFVINRPGAERLSRQIFEPDLPPTCSRWMELAARKRR